MSGSGLEKFMNPDPDPDPVCPERLDPDPVCPERLDPDPGCPESLDPDPVCPDRLDPDPVCPDRLDPDPGRIRNPANNHFNCQSSLRGCMTSMIGVIIPDLIMGGGRETDIVGAKASASLLAVPYR